MKLSRYEKCLSHLPSRVCEAEAALEAASRVFVMLSRTLRGFDMLVKKINAELEASDTARRVYEAAGIEEEIEEAVASLESVPVVDRAAQILARHPAHTHYLSKMKYVGSTVMSMLIIGNLQPWRYPTVSKMWRYWNMTPNELRVPLGKYYRVVRATMLMTVMMARTGYIASLRKHYEEKLAARGDSKGLRMKAAFRALKTLMKHYWVVYRIGMNMPLTEPYDVAKLGKMSGGPPMVDKPEPRVYLPECGEWLIGMVEDPVEPDPICVRVRQVLARYIEQGRFD